MWECGKCGNVRNVKMNFQYAFTSLLLNRIVVVQVSDTPKESLWTTKA